MRTGSGQLVVAAILVGALIGATLGCGSEPGSGPEAVTLGADDDGATITLEPGQELVVSLEGNPTTGFSWAVIGVDEAVLAPVGEPEYTPASTDSTLVGGGGTFSLRFEAVGEGETTLELGYARSWETGVEPEDTFTVAVTVE